MSELSELSDASPQIDLRVTSAPQGGYVCWEAGKIIAARSSAEAMASYLEARMTGKREAPAAEVVDMPRVVARQEPARPRGLWRTS